MADTPENPATGIRMGLATSDNVDTDWILKSYIDAVDQIKEEKRPFREMLCVKHDRKQVRLLRRSMSAQELADGSKPLYQDSRYTTYNLSAKEYGIATGITRRFIEDSSEKEVNIRLAEATRAMKDKEMAVILAAMQTKITSTSNSGWFGIATVADSDTGEDLNLPDPYGSNSWATVALHTPIVVAGDAKAGAIGHVYTTGSATLRLLDLIVAKRNIAEHGYVPDMLIINSGQMAEIEKLASWTPAATYSIPAGSVVEAFSTKGVIGQIQGLTVLVNDFIPAGYFVVIDSKEKPIGFVEVRPITVEKGDPQFGLLNSWLSCRIGAGVVKPGAGVYVTISS